MLTILASYPRSGNTWLRFIVASAVKGKIKHSREVGKIVPDIHITRGHLDGAKYAKAHFLPGYFKDIDARIIHVTRHPLDVAVSLASYVCRRDKRYGKSDVDRMAVHLCQRFIATGDMSVHSSWEKYGTWISHTESWKAQTQWPMIHLRYEDLPALDTLSSFLRIPVNDPCDIAVVMEMQKQEAGDIESILETTIKSPIPMIRSGKSGEWRRYITEEGEALMRRRYPIIDELGH